jgi:hypothetical protein
MANDDIQNIYKKTSSNTNPTKNRLWTQMIRKDMQVLLHMWHQSCFSNYKPRDRSSIRKGFYCEYDKGNISVVIYDTDIP